jgi:hypothetical protein
LKEDRVSISQLCRADAYTYQLLVPVLYHTVVLIKLEAVLSFCQAISTSIRPLKRLVQSLQIGHYYLPLHPPDNRLRKNIVPHLRLILSLLPNLRDLLLDVTPATLNICLNDLKPGFSLKRLACPCVASGAFWTFLRSQSSITTLELSGGGNLDRFVHTVPVDILPRLSNITGSMDVINPLVRLRPVSHVTITSRGVWFGCSDLVAALTEVPVQSITCIEWDPQSIWATLLGLMCDGPIPKSLKTWRVFDQSVVRQFTNTF